MVAAAKKELNGKELDALMHAALSSGPSEKSSLVAQLRATLPRMTSGHATYAPSDSAEIQDVLLRKKEFFDARIRALPDVSDFDAASAAACAPTTTSGFQLSESQIFARNFMSPRTPYSSVLLFHDVGVGKTCSALSIAERFPDRRVTIMAPTNVQSAFRRQMFDGSKVTRGSGSGSGVSANLCTGIAFLRGFKWPEDGTEPSAEELDNYAQRIISQRYTFTGFTKFANTVARLSDAEVASKYEGHVFIVDEAHNLRSMRGSDKKPAYRALMRVIQQARGCKLVLLTATPMFNDAREIVELLNLLLANDRRALLRRGAVFAEDGSITNAAALRAACAGYVSHVSGLSPLRFPLVLDPSVDGDAALLKPSDLPRLDVSGARIPKGASIREARLLGSAMSRTQYLSYSESGAMELDTDVDVDADADADADGEDAGGRGRENEEVESLPAAFRPGFEAANVAFPALPGRSRGRQRATAQFWTCFRRVPGKEFSVEYAPDSMASAHGGFLAPRNLRQFSAKFAAVIERILSSEGVVFVFSRFLWAGLVPLAVALEQAGFSRHRHRNVLSGPAFRAKEHAGSYIMLTSDTRLCSRAQFQANLAAATAPANVMGANVRVILACNTASEGIDFKFVRAVHLLDPWYHMNKVQQIIGRASRNCSHALLPSAKRNVTVYMHAALPPAELGRDARETVDVHAYRLAEFKQVRIAAVERLLIASSLDCHLNTHAQQVHALRNTRIPVETSQRTALRSYSLAKHMEALAVACDRPAPANVGSDVSTFDAWYHAPQAVAEYARIAVASVLKTGKLDHAGVAAAVARQLSGAGYDEALLTFALQSALDSGELAYRGGMYMPAHESGPRDWLPPGRCMAVGRDEET